MVSDWKSKREPLSFRRQTQDASTLLEQIEIGCVKKEEGRKKERDMERLLYRRKKQCKAGHSHKFGSLRTLIAYMS